MASDDNFGIVQDSATLLRFSWFLRGLHLAKKPGDLCSSSSQDGRTGSARRELRFDYQDQEENLSPVARSSPAVAGDLCSSSSQGGRTGSARDVVEISSDKEDSPPMARNRRFDDQEENLFPVIWNLPAVAPPQREGMASSVEDDDDCVILDSDPDSTVAVKDEKGSSGDGDSDELQIMAEKGKVACRDYPHSRHLCSNMPFGTTSHEKHCTMCYCFVCDGPAPCSYWGKGLSVDDHCHATDKETKWKALRQAFKFKNLPASHPENENFVYETMRSLDRLSLGNQIPLQNLVTQNQHTHTSIRASSNAGSTVSAPREESGTSIARTAQVTHVVDRTMSAPRQHLAAVAGSGTSNAHTAQITHHVAPADSAPTACPATRVGSGTSNAQTAQITVGAPRSRPAARAGRGTSNAYTSQITHPADPTVSAGRAYPAGRTVTSISNAHTSQITRPVEHTASEPRLQPAARTGRDTRNAHSAQNTYPTTANGYLPEPDAPEGATVYVGNLPYHIDSERLKLSFQHAGVVLFSKVIYDRETGQSRGFGYVTMSTVQEAERAVRIYHGAEVYGRPLTVNMAAPRGGARLDSTRRQSCSSLRIFVCNLPRQVDHSRLEELFRKHGQVVNARVVYERQGETWCSRGFGFVTMATEEESYNAIYSLNKQIIEGHALVVKVARERQKHPLQNVVSQNQHTHTSVRASLNVAPTASAPRAYPATRARSGTSNAHTQVIHPVEPTVRAPRSGEYRMLPLPE